MSPSSPPFVFLAGFVLRSYPRKKSTKKPSPRQGRGLNECRGTTLICRCLTTPTLISAAQRSLILSCHTARTLACNGAARPSLLPCTRVLTCNSEVIFNAGAALASHPRQLSVAVRDVYSSSSTSFSLATRPLRTLQQNIRVRVSRTNTRATKNPCISGAIASSLSPLISRNASAGIGTLPCNFAGRVVGLHRAVSLHLS